jgi:hypothetical protein
MEATCGSSVLFSNSPVLPRKRPHEHFELEGNPLIELASSAPSPHGVSDGNSASESPAPSTQTPSMPEREGGEERPRKLTRLVGKVKKAVKRTAERFEANGAGPMTVFRSVRWLEEEKREECCQILAWIGSSS